MWLLVDVTYLTQAIFVCTIKNTVKEKTMTDESGLTDLMIAARDLDYESCIELLNDPLTDPNIQDSDGKTALMHLLISSEYQPNPNKDKELAQKNREREATRLKIAQSFIAHPQTDINLSDKDGNTAYMFASQKKCNDICETILTQFDVDLHEVNYNGENAGDPAFLGLLLMNAIVHEKYELFDKLMQEKQINVNIQSHRGNTPTIIAATVNNQYALDKLLARDDIDINIQNNCGRTVFAQAIKAGQLETVMKIVGREDVDYSLKDIYGKGLEQLVVEKNDPEIFHALREVPLDYNSKASNGSPLVLYALQKKRFQVFSELNEYHMCNVNVQDPKTGDTPMILACRYNNGKICRDLMSAGADVNVVTKGGKSPIREAVFSAAKSKYTNIDCLISLLNSQKLNYASCMQGTEMISEISRRMELQAPAKVLSSLEMQLFKNRKNELKGRQQMLKNQNSEIVKQKRPRIGQGNLIFSTMINKKQKDN